MKSCLVFLSYLFHLDASLSNLKSLQSENYLNVSSSHEFVLKLRSTRQFHMMFNVCADQRGQPLYMYVIHN
jgi:hypothetical protein